MTDRIEFKGALGEPLAARIHLPIGTPRGFVLFAHCFTCSKESKAAVTISRALAERGFATLRFDFTGLGESGGAFEDTTFSSNVGDLIAAADYLRKHHTAPSLLVGHSLGGTAVLAAAARLQEVVGVATIGSPFEPTHVAHLLGDLETLKRDGEATVDIGGRPFQVKQGLVDDLQRQPAKETIAKLGKALLVFHSPTDKIVGIDNARLIYEAARHPKSFVTLDGADHLLRRRADAEYVAAVLCAWASRYLPSAEQQEETEGRVFVRGASEGFVQSIAARGHRLIADEPKDVGGTDLGPNPYEYLLTALGSCTSMTMRMYAERKKWPVERIEVALQHERVHAKDCADCEFEGGIVDLIRKEIRIEGSLDDAQQARLMEIADRCPVHRTLKGQLEIRSTQVTG